VFNFRKGGSVKNHLPVLRQTALAKSQRVVSYLTPEEVKTLVETASRGRQGERDCLLILLLFQTGLRISEALSLTPSSIQKLDGQPVLSVIGKGKRLRTVSIPVRLVDRLKSYAYERKLGVSQRFFDINRSRAWQIIKSVALKAGFNKRVYPHLFRHSDAIERLRQTGNPRALQFHLGHASSMMTMRYLNTLSEQDAIKINSEVSFDL
jgi:integrase/recombinase XerD